MKSVETKQEFDTLADIVQLFPEREEWEAIRFFNGYRIQRYTYREIYELTLRCVQWFDDSGIKKGDAILIWAPNSPQWAVVYLACALSGVILVPLDARNTADFVLKVQRETEAKMLLRTQFKKDPGLPVSSILIESLFDRLEETSPTQKLPSIQPDDCLEIVYTSGTTGNPKGVVLSHRNLASNVNGVKKRIPNAVYDTLSVLPLSHALEQTGGFWFILACGGSILYLQTLKPSALFEVFQREKITAMILVPRLLSLLKKRIETILEEKRLSWYLKFGLQSLTGTPRWLRKGYFYPIHKRFNTGFQLFVSGGASLDANVESFWRSLGFQVMQGYGLTETSPVLTVTPPERLQPGSVGLPLDQVDIRLGEGNEILARGPNVFAGYYKRPELNDEVFSDGWFKTGDIGELDAEGFLYIRGRSKDTIVTADGINVYPEDIERALEKENEVKEACVLGTGEDQSQIHAAVLLESDTVSLENLIERVNKTLPPEQRIESFSRWPGLEFPKTTTLKIKKTRSAKSPSYG